MTGEGVVLRKAMTSDDRDPAGVYFGTSTGSVFYTRDAGDSWHLLAQHLPPLYSVSVALQCVVESGLFE